MLTAVLLLQGRTHRKSSWIKSTAALNICSATNTSCTCSRLCYQLSPSSGKQTTFHLFPNHFSLMGVQGCWSLSHLEKRAPHLRKQKTITWCLHTGVWHQHSSSKSCSGRHGLVSISWYVWLLILIVIHQNQHQPLSPS